MAGTDDAVEGLDRALTELAKLYQFRGLDEPLYRGLTVSQNYCLRRLYLQGPQTMSALAAELRVRVSTMTGVVDQLEAKGLVERSLRAADRRSFEVKLTAEGKKLYQSAHKAFLSHLTPLVRRRKPAELARLVAFLAEITRTVGAWREDPRPKGRRDGKTDP
jgi:DNA-binding MarR family transcriptional regulator